MATLINLFPNLAFMTIYLLLLNLVLAVDHRTRPASNLQVTANGKFKIAIFADLHFGEAEDTKWGPHQDVGSIRVMSNVLDKENPDVITANNIMIENASLYWDQATSPTRAKGIPWSSVFGNHDDALFEWPMEWFSGSGIPKIHCPSANVSNLGKKCNTLVTTLVSSSGGSRIWSDEGKQDCNFKGTHRLDLMRYEIEKSRLSYSKIGPRELLPSVSNYVLQISSPNDPRSPLTFMYFLDSGGGSYPQVVSKAQADWFKNKSHELNPDFRVPEIIFWHIPSKAYKKVAPMFMTFSSCVGSINKESVASQEAEMGIMKVIEKRPSVKAIFVGHNHGLDWCCPYNKIQWLCFARHTGYGGYGNWPRGARVLEIDSSHSFSLKTWIRMEDGTSHSELVLSP